MSKLSIAIAGITGKMGKSLAYTALQIEDIQLTAATVSPDSHNTKTIDALLGTTGLDFFPKQQLSQCVDDFDVLIDFTCPEATLEHLAICSAHNKPMVIGTTGFNAEQMMVLRDYSKKIPIVFASNMSRGVTITSNLIQQLATLIGNEADIEIMETHHRHKKDAPSGTALTLGEKVASALGESLSDIACFNRVNDTQVGQNKKIGFSVVRAGDIIGEHTVMFALPGERIEIKHIATNRDTFSKGALTAARWVKNQSPDLYDMQAVLGLL